MTDSTASPTELPPAPPSPPPAGDPPAAAAPEPKKPTRRQRWKRRLIVVALSLLFVILLARVLLVFILPPTLRKVAGVFDLDCTYDHMELYLLSGDVGIWDLKVTPKEGGSPILAVDYCRAYVSTTDLLHGRLVVRRLEADSAEVHVDREADGTIPLLKRFVSSQSAAKPAPVPSGKPTPIDLTSPLEIDRLRLQHAHLSFTDKAVSPTTTIDLETSIRLTDLGVTGQQAHLSVEASSSEALDLARFEMTASSENKNLAADLELTIRGFHPKPLTPYLQPFGIRPTADGIAVHAAGKLSTTPAPGGADALQASIAFTDLALTTDGHEAAGLKTVAITADSIDRTGAHFGTLTIDGGHVELHRSASGLGACGFELAPPAAAPATRPSAVARATVNPSLNAAMLADASDVSGLRESLLLAATDTPGKMIDKLDAATTKLAIPMGSATTAPSIAAAPATQPATGPVITSPITLRQLVLSNLTASFDDSVISPAAALSFSVRDLRATADPDNLAAPMTIAGQLAAPGICRDIRLTGSAAVVSPAKRVQLSLAVDGVQPTAIAAYLAAAGVGCDLHDGKFTADIDAGIQPIDGGAIAASVQLKNLSLTDSGELFALNSVSAVGLSLGKDGVIRAQDIAIQGPHLSVARNGDGTLAALGFHTLPPSHATAAALPTTMIASASPATTRVAAAHAATAPATQPTLGLPAIEIGTLTWNGVQLHLFDRTMTPAGEFTLSDFGVELKDINTHGTETTHPGTLHAWMNAPGVADHLEARGVFAAYSDTAKIDLAVDGQHITLAALKPYLQPAGVAPTLTDGQLHLQATAELKVGDTISTRMFVDRLSWKDGERELVGLDNLAVLAELTPTGIAIPRVDVDHPRLFAARGADGSLAAAGFVTVIPPPSTRPAMGDGSSPAPIAATIPPTGNPALLPPLPVVTLGALTIKDAAVRWEDALVSPAAGVTANVGLSLSAFTIGKDAPPATLNLTAAVPGVLERASVEGQLSVAPKSQFAKLAIDATGVQIGALASYVPNTLRIDVKNGHFATQLNVELTENADNELASNVSLKDMHWADGDSPLVSLDALSLKLATLDNAKHRIAIDEVVATGLSADAKKSADGFHVAGITALSAPPAPAVSASASTMPAVAAIQAPSPIAQRVVLPYITIAKLELGATHVRFTDETRPNASPITLTDGWLWNREPIQLLGRDASALPAVSLELSGKIAPLVEAGDVQIKAAPFAEPATLAIDVAVNGIHGPGVTAIAPELADKLDGAALTDGSFTAHIEASAKLDRTNPLDFDPSRPIDLDVLLQKIAFRQSPTGDVLAGVDEVRSDGVRIEPAVPRVHVKALEINNPILRASREKDGLHAVGLTIKLPATQPASTQPAAAEAAPATPPPAPVAANASPASPLVTVDKIIVSGITAQIDDRAVEPAFSLPLNSLDVEVRDLAVPIDSGARPLRFNALVGAGKVMLPRKDGGEEMRDLLSQITAAGQVSFVKSPAGSMPRGWFKANVSGFDLDSLRGEAAAFGVTLGGGTFDTNVDLRFTEDGTLDAHTKTTLTDLSLSEPPDGPISKLLHLPAPLDVAISALTDPAGGITLPLSVTMPQGKISYGSIAEAGVGAISSVMVTAIASAPLKMAGGAAKLIGFDSGKEEPEEPIILQFAAGDSALSAQNQKQLAALLKRLRDDSSLEVTVKTSLGGGDVTVAKDRGTPTREECLALMYQLRQRKAELLRKQQELAGVARAQLGSGQASASLVDLQNTARALATTDDALDQVGDLLRPGADRQEARRTRAVAIDIAQARIDAVQAVFSTPQAKQIERLSDRLHVTHAQFAAVPGDGGGTVTLTIAKSKN